MRLSKSTSEACVLRAIETPGVEPTTLDGQDLPRLRAVWIPQVVQERQRYVLMEQCHHHVASTPFTIA